MQEELMLGYLIGGLITLLGLYWGIEKFNERGQKRVDMVNEKLERINSESNVSNRELTKAIHELTKTVELMNQNMMGIKGVVENHNARLGEIEERIRKINNRCVFEHRRVPEE